MRAIVRQREHDFDAALADLDTLIAAEPANLQALLTRAVVRQVRAEYTRAAADCETIANLRATLAATICSASVAGAGRDASASYHTFADAIAHLNAGAPEALRSWALSVLAELAARLDDAAVAERRFREALAFTPQDGYLLGAYADFLLDHDRPREVVDLLAEQTNVDPLLLRLAIAEHRIDPGSPGAEAHIAALADRFAAAAARGESVHRREEARFALTLLSAPRRALALAIANWQVQREPADARVLLESALAAGNRAAAGPALRWLDANGLHRRSPRRAGPRGRGLATDLRGQSHAPHDDRNVPCHRVVGRRPRGL